MAEYFAFLAIDLIRVTVLVKPVNSISQRVRIIRPSHDLTRARLTSRLLISGATIDDLIAALIRVHCSFSIQ